MTTEPTGRLQPEVSFRKVEVSSLSVPSSIRMMARQSPLPLLGRAAGNHWLDKMKAQGLLLPTCPSRMLWGLLGQLEQFREAGLKLVDTCILSL